MKRQEGFTLIELMVVILIIGILVAIAVPVFFSSQTNAKKGACQDNLRTIDGAIMMYASDNVGNYPATVAELDGVYVREMPDCEGTAYGQENAGTALMRSLCMSATGGNGTGANEHTY